MGISCRATSLQVKRNYSSSLSLGFAGWYAPRLMFTGTYIAGVVRLVISRLVMSMAFIRARVLPTVAKLVIASRAFVNRRLIAMWFVVLGQATCMVERGPCRLEAQGAR